MSFWATVLALGAHPSPVAAQLRADSSWKDLKRLGGDVWSMWTSPVHATAGDLRGVAAVAAIAGVAAAGDAPLQHWIKDHPDTWPVRVLLHPLREDARYPAYELGSGQYLLPLSAALYIAGSASRSRGLRDAGLGCAAAHLTSAGAREIVYLLLARDRPRLSPDDPFRFHFPGTRDWNAHSFFSGHIANSMGCASFFAHRFALHAAEPVIYAFVMAIGAGRVVDGRHWLSDTVVGSLFGYATGRTISARMRARERAAPAVPTTPLTVSFSVPFE
jgi:membrane-associated phospholipid phosphatase